MAIAESTHWYSKEGKPAYTVIGKNGKERATTLRDAREYGFLPSVTTIMGVAAKPMLEEWKINQALMSALTLPRLPDESLDDFMARAKQDAKDQSIKAAERGTVIHADIERGFSEGVTSVAYEAVKAVLDGLCPGAKWIAEDSFGSDMGYGGKVDLYSPSGIFVDFKSKEFKDGDTGAKLVYDEHGLQLSAYAEGMGFENPRRISIFVDRNDPSKVLFYEWDAATHTRHAAMFFALLNYWQMSKNYIPGKSE